MSVTLHYSNEKQHLCRHCKLRRRLAHTHAFPAVTHACCQDDHHSVFVYRAALATTTYTCEGELNSFMRPVLEYTCCLQGCTCLNTYTFQKVNGTASCVPALVDTYRSISITLLVVVPALAVFFVVLDAVGRLRRGSYEKFVLRWVKRKGAPGAHTSCPPCNYKLILCMCCQHHLLCAFMPAVISLGLLSM